MIKINTYIPEPVVRKLDQIAGKKDVTRAEVIRQALQEFIDKISTTKQKS